MIEEKEAQELAIKYLSLKKKSEKNPHNKKLLREFKNHQDLCVQKFAYLVNMRTNKYKTFSNFEDLQQEGYYALINGLNNYNSKLGSVFYWLHQYISTRISRQASFYTAIRIPLNIAKNTPPIKVLMPLLINSNNPNQELEDEEVKYAIGETMQYLSTEEEQILTKFFGLDGDKPLTINKICKTVGISRTNCIKTLHSAINIVKEKIKL